MNTAGLILAAGQSSRMHGHKALLPWGNSTIIEWEIKCLQSAGISDIFVVLGYNAKDIIKLITNLDVNIIINENWITGRSSSIAKAMIEVIKVTELKKISHLLIQNVDQPLSNEIITQLNLFIKENNLKNTIEVLQPIYKEKITHPVVIHKSVFNNLLRVEDYKLGLKEVIKDLKRTTITINSPLLTLNINTKQDYQTAQKILKD
jgi:molybdenum cofactor cytidylyltransferase|tara:strand:- start:1461 stop:2075 length:615 start_codon:yes stop_codon:yes gene_type:complete